MRIAISNVFSDDNRGGAVLTQAAISFARSLDPTAQIVLVPVSAQPAESQLRHTLEKFPECAVVPPVFSSVVDRRLGGVSAVALSALALAAGRFAQRFSPTLRDLASANVVISKGGHVFVERHGLRGVMGLWLTAFPLTYARRCGVRTVALGATIGPFRSRSSRWLNGKLLRVCDVVAPRDAASARMASELRGGWTGLVQMPDGIFSPWRTSTDSVDGDGGIVERYVGRHERFAVVTTSYPAEDEDHFTQTMSDALDRLLSEEVIDRVLVPLQAMTPDRHSSDRLLSERLVSSIGGEVARLVDDDLSPEDLVHLYSQSEFVLGRRLHSVLFGILGGRPSLALAHPTEPAKAEQLFTDLGLAALVIEVSTPEVVYSRVCEALARSESLRERSAAIIAAQESAWLSVSDEIRQLLSVK